jgi:hypothetical protein
LVPEYPQIFCTAAANGAVGFLRSESITCSESIPANTALPVRRPTAQETKVTEEDLLAFIATSIGSVWALELLLLLKREPSRRWNADALVRELRSSPIVIGEALQQLRTAGLIAQDSPDAYRFRTASPQVNLLVSELEKAYATKPMTVIKAIVTGRDK